MFGFIKKKVTVCTHNGSFHADEVFACATLSLWAGQNGKDLKIIRTRDQVSIENADIVVDVGMQCIPEKDRFDHHQRGGAGEHDNGIPYASFGLVWEKFGEAVSGSKEMAKMIEQKLVMPVDARDNGVNISSSNKLNIFDYAISDCLSNFNPTWLEKQDSMNGQFEKALFFAKEVLKRELASARSASEGFKITEMEIQRQNSPEILILENYLDWERAVSKHKDVKFVVYKHRNGKHWCIQVGRDDLEDYDSKRAVFPTDWWSLRDTQLESVTGVIGAMFCSNKGWFATTKTKEGAIEMVKMALQRRIN